MKILFYNPHIDETHEIARALRERQIALLHPDSLEDASEILQFHGSSLDLAIIHREAPESPQAGVNWIEKTKLDPLSQDLPIILTTEGWGSEECARHQESPSGANAYLRYPFTAEALLELIGAVLGHPAPPQSLSVSPSYQLESPVLDRPTHVSLPVTEDPTLHLESALEPISLEAPDMPRASDFDPIPVLDGGLTAQTLHVSETPKFQGNSDEPIPSLPPQNTSTVVYTSEFAKAIAESAPPFNLGANLSTNPASHSATLAPSLSPELSYLEEQEPKAERRRESPLPQASVFLGSPLDEAIIPGMVGQTPDMEVMKRYLALREQDVSVLSAEIRRWKSQLESVKASLDSEKALNGELSHQVHEYEEKLTAFEGEKKEAIESLEKELTDSKFELKKVLDEKRELERQLKIAGEETGKIKERVRIDIRKIRVQEKELENKLEILKKDSDALLSFRETKIMELKRKVDLLEFNMDLLQGQYTHEKEINTQLKDRLNQAAQIVRVAEGLLDSKMKLEIKSQ